MISNIWRNRTSIFFSEINTSVVLESLTSNASGKYDVHFLSFFFSSKAPRGCGGEKEREDKLPVRGMQAATHHSWNLPGHIPGER